ncbi:glycosyltransferase [Altererythrobacter luteolus]|uniref:Glycosyltransferase n=1 Tax=Pontixanthobacter luteolus TaxID=295089 RepID=A0A6I4V1A6_9SPHN|nr:glycosyltransferase [Pontixanthobacter luteolus]MXP47733.1 glycosyltransferase [Pontixanthobacter luteolus]
MNILHVIASCDRTEGGPVEGVFRLGDAFREMGHEQELLTLDHSDDAAVRDAPSVVHALGRKKSVSAGIASRALNWSRYSPAAVDWLREHADEYDGVIVDGLWNFSTRVARLGLQRSRTPYIVFSHGMLDPWFRSRYPLKHLAKSVLWQFNEGPLMRGAAAAAFTTERERDLAKALWRPWGITEQVVGYGTAAPPAESPSMKDAFQGRVSGLQAAPYLLFLGRIHEKKGGDILVNAFGDFWEGSDAHLVIAGPGDASFIATLRELAAKSGCAERIHWPGMLEGDEKWGALYGCDAMILPSHQENFGVVVAEALGCGRPVIISDQVNISGDVQRAQAGIICHDTRASVAEAMTRFFRLDAGAREAMGERGKRLFQTQFNIARTAEELVEILSHAKR